MAGTGETGLSTPIESYIKYFNNIKPYHTKILEVLEQYNFFDTINIDVIEDLLSDYTLSNRKLCDTLDIFEDFDDGFTFQTTYSVIGYDNASDQVFLDGNVENDFSVGDAIALFGSSTNLRPIITEITGLTYNMGANRTEIDVTLDIESGEYDSYTQAGKEFCNLFTPISGGFGEIFDDDQIVSASTFATAPVPESSQVVLDGNYSYDQRFQVQSIPNATTLIVAGDISSFIGSIDAPTDGVNTVFRIVPKKTYDIVSCTSNTVVVSGNQTADVLRNREFDILGTGPNDGRFSAVSAVYSGVDDQTTITISATQTIDTSYCDGIVSLNKSTRNLGVYLISNVVFNGTNTLVTVDATTPFPFTDVTEANNHGSLMLRTAFSNRRVVSIEGEREGIDKQYSIPNTFHPENDQPLTPTPTIGVTPTPTPTSGVVVGSNYDFDASFAGFDWNVIPNTTTITDFDYIVDYVEYDADTDETTVTLRGELPTTITGSTLNLIGHFGFGGYDGAPDTNDPQDVHIYTAFRENLNIVLELVPTATPTVTPTFTPTPTPTPTLA